MDVLIDLDSIREKQPTTILTCHRTELDWTHNTKIRFTQFHCSRFSTRKKVKDGRMTNASQPPKGPPSDLTLVLMYTIAPPIGELRPKKN